MQELRLVAVSEDGTYLVLATAGRGTRFTLPVDDRLRAAVRGHFSRLGQFEIEVESPLRPKEIQARIRAGETAEEIAESAGIPVERVRWFEGPVLQEREYMAQQAQRVPVRRPGETAPGPPLGEMVEERLNRGGVDLEDVEWDSWKCEDSSWRVRLSFFDDGRPHAAEWLFDPRRRHLSPRDEVAARLTAQEWDGGAADESADTVTPLLPRRPAMKIVQDSPSPSPSQSPAAASRTTAAQAAEPARREYAVERGRTPDPRPQAENAPAPLTPAPPTPAAAPPRPPATPATPTAPSAPAAQARPSGPHRPLPEPDLSVPPPPMPRAEEPPAPPRPAVQEPPAPADAEDDPPAVVEEPETVPEVVAEERPAENEPEAPATEEDEPEVPAAEQSPQPGPEPEAQVDSEPEEEPERAAAPAPAPRTPAKPAAAKARSRREKTPARPAPAAPAAPAPAPAPAAAAAPAAEVPVAEPAAARDVPVPAPAPTPAQRQSAAARRRKSKGKRASVPSWDEIMFGARRPD